MGAKILIVDDEPEIPNALRGVLEPLGYEVKLCESGLDVIDALRSYQPGLMIMDVMLPGVDGYTLVSRISDGEDAELAGMPIIVMSALETSRCMFERFPQVAAFFAKPFSIEELSEAVETVFAKKE
jgi:DNA-binding response OmpR family regulator